MDHQKPTITADDYLRVASLDGRTCDVVFKVVKVHRGVVSLISLMRGVAVHTVSEDWLLQAMREGRVQREQR